MDIGIILETYSHWGHEKWKKLHSHGFTCTDYNMMCTDAIPYTLSDEEFIDFMKREKALADEAGVRVSQVHGPWRDPQDATEEDRRERMEKMQKSIHGAALLGSKNWVIHPLMPFGTADTLTKDGQKTFDINLAFMSQLADYAKEFGVTVCLENMPFKNFSLASPTDTLRFVQAVNRDNFKICLDTGHAAIFHGCAMGDVVRLLGQNICALHIHDNDGNNDQHQMPYNGIIDWRDFACALKETGFNGCFSFETGICDDLPDPLYEEMCIVYRKTAEFILQEGGYNTKLLANR